METENFLSIESGADMMLREEEVEEDFIRQARLFHFGTLSMTHEEVRKATKSA